MSALDDMRERLAAATELGEWEVRGKDVVIYDPNGFGAHRVVARVDHAEYTAPIANAPTDMGKLLAAVEGVLALHSPNDPTPSQPWVTCSGCTNGCSYPCPTVVALTEALEEL
ncbi:hypothetical protein [Arthrobacter sp. ISL-69]|uniref:hypothetical protein n=1 Tax=Arthrobacter sp. ISL-69 TaxID=2819113 RepID=UPI001BE84BD4|nr:hypothetical protein [Arthrobacter sp. ISL-69]MBT2537231.1 hypothetical protein [Arthrobacter sp. ISL-69]